MNQFVWDSFTDISGTSIGSHTGEIGAIWNPMYASVLVPTIQSNLLDAGASDGNAYYYASGVPHSADYSASCDIIRNTSALAVAGCGVRIATDHQTGYFGILFSANGIRASIYRYSFGNLQLLVEGNTVVPPATGVAIRLTLDVSGTTLTLKHQRLSDGYYAAADGSWQAAETAYASATDSTITEAGRPGFWLSGGPDRYKIESFSATQQYDPPCFTEINSTTANAVASISSLSLIPPVTGISATTANAVGNIASVSESSDCISQISVTTASAVGAISSASAGVFYTRVDANDTITGQPIMILLPQVPSSNPYNALNPTPVILYAHGYGGDEYGLVTESLKFGCRDALLDAGYILAQSEAHGNNLGNQASVDDYAALEKFVRENYNVKAVALWGQSMGGLDALSVVAQGKVPVVGALLTYPMCNLAHAYSNGWDDEIDTAYGITGIGNSTYDNKTYGMDPQLKPADAYRDTPMRFYASYGDTWVPMAQNTDLMAAKIAGTRLEADVVVCSGDHGDPSHFQPSDYLAFFNRCFAAASRNITITLVSSGGVPESGASGLKWAFWETALPGSLLAPVAQGTVEATDGSGVLNISITTRLAPGEVGWLIVTNSDGEPGTVHKAFSGPVQVQ